MPEGEQAVAQARRALSCVPPAEFVARRKEMVTQARADGDRELAATIGTMRKPTSSAWVVNLLVDRYPQLIGELVELGRATRRTGLPDTAALTEFREQRASLMRRLVSLARSQAADVAVRLGPAAIGEVEQTLGAALAEEQAALAVLDGTLVQPLRHTGLGEGPGVVSTAGPPRPSSTGRRPARAGTGRSEIEQAARRRAVAAAAQADLDRAIADLAVADRERDEANRVLAAAELRVAGAERELAAATEAEHRAEAVFAEANDKHDRAVASVRLAQATLDGLTRRR